MSRIRSSVPREVRRREGLSQRAGGKPAGWGVRGEARHSQGADRREAGRRGADLLQPCRLGRLGTRGRRRGPRAHESDGAPKRPPSGGPIRRAPSRWRPLRLAPRKSGSRRLVAGADAEGCQDFVLGRCIPRRLRPPAITARGRRLKRGGGEVVGDDSIACRARSEGSSAGWDPSRRGRRRGRDRSSQASRGAPPPPRRARRRRGAGRPRASYRGRGLSTHGRESHHLQRTSKERVLRAGHLEAGGPQPLLGISPMVSHGVSDAPASGRRAAETAGPTLDLHRRAGCSRLDRRAGVVRSCRSRSPRGVASPRRGLVEGRRPVDDHLG